MSQINDTGIVERCVLRCDQFDRFLGSQTAKEGGRSWECRKTAPHPVTSVSVC